MEHYKLKNWEMENVEVKDLKIGNLHITNLEIENLKNKMREIENPQYPSTYRLTPLHPTTTGVSSWLINESAKEGKAPTVILPHKWRAVSPK